MADLDEIMARQASDLADRLVKAGDQAKAIEMYRTAYSHNPAFHVSTGMPMDYFRGLARMVCPYCHAWLQWSADKACCPSRDCKGQFPLLYGEIPVFFKPGEHNFARTVFGLSGHAADSEPLRAGRMVSKFRDRASPMVWRRILSWLKSCRQEHGFLQASDEIVEIIDRTRGIQYNSIFNIYMKCAEAILFSRFEPTSPSLEFGGNYGLFTNLIYGGRSRIDYSSEYLADPIYGTGYLNPDCHAVFDCLFCSPADRFPLPDASLNTVLSMHILDHVGDLDACLCESARVLKPGGKFVATTYGNGVELPEFRFLDKLGLKAAAYRNWRLTKKNPRGGGRYVADGDYATGRNMMPLKEWRKSFDRCGFDLISAHPYSRKSIISWLMDVEYQGFYCPQELVAEIASVLAGIIEAEIASPIPYEAAQNVFFVANRR